MFFRWTERGASRAMNFSQTKKIAAVTLLLTGYSICRAQAHDPNNPVPLGPGVNKGNVDNKTNGPNYYYFYAGPGHLEMHYAFKSLGVLGSPMREALSFDLYQENNKLIVHDAIVSVDKMEKLSRPGDLGTRHKLVIRVIAPQQALRLGGYYEIEATGAVSFAGEAAGADVKPENTDLYRPGGSLYTPVGALTTVNESPKELRLTLASDILFDFDEATIRPDAKATLDRVAEIVRSKSHGIVGIWGFSDSMGAPDYNLRLSRARAESVENWLIGHAGLRAAQFAARGFGATRFVSPNTKSDGGDDPVGRQKNRRVEIVIQKQD
jgi:outer membrane protein OmpA-like peptidoglycan-associated protein